MKNIDIVQAITPVVNAFNKLGILYYIGGSVASSAYGLARATMNVDFVSNISNQHVSKFVKIIERAYYIDENMILDAIKNKSFFNLIHLETMLKVDIFIVKDNEYHKNTLQQKKKNILDEDKQITEVYFASAEDVILSKLQWFRMGGNISERQWKDVLGVINVQQESLNIDYLKHWAQELDLADLLDKTFTESKLNL